MKRAILFLVGVTVLMSGTGLAQTPDGTTPAEEMVCDVLKAEGITKGLYGLCVAFCEARDYASISAPITDAELDALDAAIPSGRILENYNNRRTEFDPPMPCIKVEEPCPCWTEAEFLTTSQAAFDSDFNANACADNWRDGGTLHTVFDTEVPQNLVMTYENTQGSGPYCQYFSEWDGMNGIFRLTFLTPEELGACRNRIIARQAEFGLIPSTTIQKKPYCLSPEG